MTATSDDNTKRMRDFLEAAPDAMIVVNRHGLIALVNAEAERLFGYARDELFDQPVETLIPEGRRHGHADRRQEYAKEPRVREMGAALAIEGRRKDGSTFSADIKLSPFGEAVIAAVRDVSLRRAEENRLNDLIRELTASNEKLQEQERRLLAQEAALTELSIPVLEIEDGVMLFPAVGLMDSERAARVKDDVPCLAAERGARVVIVDVTGVAVVDTATARVFADLAQILSLLGAKCLITGIRPAVAQTMVEQGIEPKGFATYATLKTGIAAARSFL